MPSSFDPRIEPILRELGMSEYQFTMALIRRTRIHEMMDAVQRLYRRKLVDDSVYNVFLETISGPSPLPGSVPFSKPEVDPELKYQPEAWRLKQKRGQDHPAMAMDTMSREQAEEVYPHIPGVFPTWTPKGEKAIWGIKPPDEGKDFSDPQQASGMAKHLKLGTHRAVAIQGPGDNPLQRFESQIKVGSWEQSPAYRFKANLIWTGFTSTPMPEGQILAARGFTGTDTTTLKVSNFQGGQSVDMSFDDVLGSAQKIMSRDGTRQLGTTGDWQRVKYLADKIVTATNQYGRQSPQLRVIVQRFIDESGLKADYLKGALGGVAENPAQFGIPQVQGMGNQPQVITNITNIKNWLAVPERLISGVIAHQTQLLGNDRGEVLRKLGLTEQSLEFVPGAGKRIPEDWIRACEKIAQNQGFNYVDQATGNMNLPMLGEFTREGAWVAKKNRWSPEASRLMREVDPIGYRNAVNDPYNRRITGHYQNVLTSAENMARQLSGGRMPQAERFNLTTMTGPGGINIGQAALERAQSYGPKLTSGSLYQALGEVITNERQTGMFGFAAPKTLNAGRMLAMDVMYKGKPMTLDIMSPKDAAYFSNKDHIRRHLIAQGQGEEYQKALSEFEQVSSRLVNSYENIIQHQVRYGNSRPQEMDRLIEIHAKQLDTMQRSRSTQQTANSVFIKQGAMAMATGSFNLAFNEGAVGDDIIVKAFGSQLGAPGSPDYQKRLNAVKDYLDKNDVSVNLSRNPDITQAGIMKIRLRSTRGVGISSTRGVILHPVLASQAKGDFDGDMFAMSMSSRLKVDKAGNVFDVMGSQSPKPSTELGILQQVSEAAKLRGGGYAELTSSLKKLGIPESSIANLAQQIDAGEVDKAHSILRNLQGARDDTTFMRKLRAAYESPMISMEQEGGGRQFTGIAKKYMGIAYNFNRQLQVTGAATGKKEEYAKFVEIIYKANQDKERMSPGLTRFLDFMSRYQPASGGLRKGGYENDFGFMGRDVDQAMLEALKGLYNSDEFKGKHERELLANIMTENEDSKRALLMGDENSTILAFGLTPWTKAHQFGSFTATLKAAVASGWKRRLEGPDTKASDANMTESDIRAALIGDMLHSSLYVEGRKQKHNLPEYDSRLSADENLKRTGSAIRRHELIDRRLRARAQKGPSWMWQELDPSTAPRNKMIWHNPLTGKDQEYDEPLPDEPYISFAAGWDKLGYTGFGKIKSVKQFFERLPDFMTNFLGIVRTADPEGMAATMHQGYGKRSNAYGVANIGGLGKTARMFNPNLRSLGKFQETEIVFSSRFEGSKQSRIAKNTAAHEVAHVMDAVYGFDAGQTKHAHSNKMLWNNPLGGSKRSQVEFSFAKQIYHDLRSSVADFLETEEGQRYRDDIRSIGGGETYTDDDVANEAFADIMSHAITGSHLERSIGSKVKFSRKAIDLASKLMRATQNISSGSSKIRGVSEMTFADGEEDAYGERPFSVDHMTMAMMDMLRHGPRGLARSLPDNAKESLSHMGSRVEFGASSVKTWVKAASREISAAGSAMQIPALREAAKAWLEQGRMHLTMPGMAPVSPQFSFADEPEGFWDDNAPYGEPPEEMLNRRNNPRPLPASAIAGGQLVNSNYRLRRSSRPALGGSVYAAMHGTPANEPHVARAQMERQVMIDYGIKGIEYGRKFRDLAPQAVREALAGTLEYQKYAGSIGSQNIGWKALETMSAEARGIGAPNANVRKAGNVLLDMLQQTGGGTQDMLQQIGSMQKGYDARKEAKAAAQASGITASTKPLLSDDQMSRFDKAFNKMSEAFAESGKAVEKYTTEQKKAIVTVAEFADQTTGPFSAFYKGKGGAGDQARAAITSMELSGVGISSGSKKRGIGAALGIEGYMGMMGIRQITGGIGQQFGTGFQDLAMAAQYGSGINSMLGGAGAGMTQFGAGGFGNAQLSVQQSQLRMAQAAGGAVAGYTGLLGKGGIPSSMAGGLSALGAGGEAFWSTALPLAMMGGELAPWALPVGAAAGVGMAGINVLGQELNMIQNPRQNAMQRAADPFQQFLQNNISPLTNNAATQALNQNVLNPIIGAVNPILGKLGLSQIGGQFVTNPSQLSGTGAGISAQAAVAQQALYANMTPGAMRSANPVDRASVLNKYSEYMQGQFGYGTDQQSLQQIGQVATQMMNLTGNATTTNPMTQQFVDMQQSGFDINQLTNAYSNQFGGTQASSLSGWMQYRNDPMALLAVQRGMGNKLFQAQSLMGVAPSMTAMAGVGNASALSQLQSNISGGVAMEAIQAQAAQGYQPSALVQKYLSQVASGQSPTINNMGVQQQVARFGQIQDVFAAGGNIGLGTNMGNALQGDARISRIAMQAAQGDGLSTSYVGQQMIGQGNLAGRGMITRELSTGAGLFTTQAGFGGMGGTQALGYVQGQTAAMGQALGKAFVTEFSQSSIGKAFLASGGAGGLMGAQSQLMLSQQSAANQRLGIQKEQYEFQYAPGGMTEQQRALALQQFNENWNLSYQQTQTGYQFQQVGMGRQQMMTQIQHGYAQEDIQYQRSQTARGFGEQMWQMNYQMPYLTGRERRLAEHNKEYAVGSYNIEQGRQTVLAGREKEQFDLSMQWLGVEMAQQKVMHDFQMQALQLQKKHFMENYALEGKNIEMQAKWARENLAIDAKLLKDQQDYEKITKLLSDYMTLTEGAIEKQIKLDYPGWLQQVAGGFNTVAASIAATLSAAGGPSVPFSTPQNTPYSATGPTSTTPTSMYYPGSSSNTGLAQFNPSGNTLAQGASSPLVVQFNLDANTLIKTTVPGVVATVKKDNLRTGVQSTRNR